MQTIKLKQAMFIDTAHHQEGDLVRLADARAADLIRGGYAERSEGEEAEAANPLADAIQPLPPGGVNASPEDAALPLVQDNPGLLALETAAKSGAPRRAAKVTGKAE